MVGIYKITNLINHKCYIGQSQNIEQRWKDHRTRPFNPNAHQYNSPLYRAIRKYGLKNFNFEVLLECSLNELNEEEIYYIQKFNSTDPNYGYNLTKGGQNSIKIKLTEEQINQIYDLLINSKLSEAKIGEKFQVSQRLISDINLGRLHLKSGYDFPLRKQSILKKESIYCIDCGTEIKTKGKQYCPVCAKKHQRIVERPNRIELKKLIREKSFLEIGRIYNVSDNAIRKWCKAENLPTSKRQIKQISDKDWIKI